MKTPNQALIDEALAAISAVHSDNSVGLATTLESLEVLRDEAQDCMDLVTEDLQKRKSGGRSHVQV